MSKQKKKKRIHPKFLMIVLTFLCLILMFASYVYADTFTPAREFVDMVLTPMQRGINTFGLSIYKKLDNLKDINALLEENQELKDRVSELEYENILLRQDKNELDELRNLYALDKQYIDYPKVAARIISRDTNNYYSIFKIDKGSADGIKVDMNVIAGNGLVGIVTEVYTNSARVRSIIDDTSSVGGMFLETSDTCIVNGNLETLAKGYIDVEMISLNSSAEESYEVVTSHISNKYLPGILIGYIRDIEIDSSNMMKKAHLIPVVDFEHLEEVLIITELKEIEE